jgi:hypothetical protein
MVSRVSSLNLLAHDLRAYANLLGRLMPLQVHGGLTIGVTAVNVVSVPSDSFLPPEVIERFQLPPAPALVIDNAIDNDPATADAVPQAGNAEDAA